ncbi:hypothetical protein NITHO_230016 [Nitrolancea hollandica Lb]|uniref:Uncharacterized protein n=1 Tax=Nitrolancea hollandica Lb TaxID=1129897 RepID=I4EFI3_9BACT|nr:hypothetical protein NITHO_230016 [Nitrolancea hollandica Lb]
MVGKFSQGNAIRTQRVVPDHYLRLSIAEHEDSGDPPLHVLFRLLPKVVVESVHATSEGRPVVLPERLNGIALVRHSLASHELFVALRGGAQVLAGSWRVQEGLNEGGAFACCEGNDLVRADGLFRGCLRTRDDKVCHSAPSESRGSFDQCFLGGSDARLKAFVSCFKCHKTGSVPVRWHEANCSVIKSYGSQPYVSIKIICASVPADVKRCRIKRGSFRFR